jgi:hypothetical protein
VQCCCQLNWALQPYTRAHGNNITDNVGENQAAGSSFRQPLCESRVTQYSISRERAKPALAGVHSEVEFRGLFDHIFCFCVHLTDKWRNLRISRLALLSFLAQLVINSSYKQHLHTFLRMLLIPLGERERIYNSPTPSQTFVVELFSRTIYANSRWN